MRTSEEGGGWAADTGVEGGEGVSGIRPKLVVRVLGREGDWFEIVPEPIRRPILDGQVEGEEKQGHQGGDGEEGSFPFPE
jgi:hypothetical protein